MHVRTLFFTIVSICAVAGAACGSGGNATSKTPAAAASSEPPGATTAASQTKPAATTAASPTSAGGDASSAEAWCALVIDINTRHGYMKDKQYPPIQQVSSDILKAIVDEELLRRDEILAITPPEIKDAMTAELDYYVAAKANNFIATTPLGAFTRERQQQLVTFQQNQCGITFG